MCPERETCKRFVMDKGVGWAYNGKPSPYKVCEERLIGGNNEFIRRFSVGVFGVFGDLC